MTTDPVADADAHTEQLGKQQDRFERARERAELEIRTSFAAWFAGSDAVVPCTIYDGGMRVLYQPADEAVDDATDFKETLQAHRELLQGKITVEQYRAVLVNKYIGMLADDIASLWAT